MNDASILLFQETGSPEHHICRSCDGIRLIRISDLGDLSSLEPDNLDLILVCQGNFTLEALTHFKTGSRTRYIPLFYLYSDFEKGWDEIKNLKVASCGLPDDFIPVTTPPEILTFKILGFLRNLEEARSTNPLTGLPGNKLIEEEIAHRLKNKSGCVLIYADLNNFKPYNDLYGFSRGDDVIRFLAKTLREVAMKSHSPDNFLGHIGGDDFIMIIREEKTDSVTNSIQQRFSSGLINFYTEKDLARGSIVSWNRDGERSIFPLVGLSLISLPLDGRFNTIAEISKESARLKKMAKRKAFIPGKTRVIKINEDEIEPNLILKRCAENEGMPLTWRRAALEALGEIGDEEGGAFFTEFLSREEKARLRKSAAYAIGRVKSPGLSKLLLPYLNDPDPHVRTRAVEALGTLGDSEPLSVIQALNNDPNPYVRSAVMGALGRMGDKTSLAILHAALQDKDMNVRLSAVESLGELKSDESLPYLKEQLSSGDIKLRYSAAWSIVKLSTPEAVNILTPLLTGKNPYLIWLALKGLSGLLETGWDKRDEPLFRTLIKLLSNFNSYIRRQSAIALGYWGDAGAVKPLITMLKDKNEFVRWSAAEALGRLGSQSSLLALINSLNDKNEYVRSTVCRALGEIKSSRALEPLRKTLKDPSDRVRESAAYSITNILSNL